MTDEEATRLWVAQENARITDLTCTICGEENLDYDACFNCKGMKECINCCGCLGEEEEE